MSTISLPPTSCGGKKNGKTYWPLKRDSLRLAPDGACSVYRLMFDDHDITGVEPHRQVGAGGLQPCLFKRIIGNAGCYLIQGLGNAPSSLMQRFDRC